MKYLAFRLAAFLVPRLPVWLSYGAAWLGAEAAFRAVGARREVVAANMRQVLGAGAPPAEVEAAARSVFRTGAYNYVDLFLIPSIAPEELPERVEVINTAALLAARDRGKGVIIVTAHLGN